MINIPTLVKEALRAGIYKKNYRFIVYDADGVADFVLDNNSLITESVSFDEHMASTETLKFGLCEGTSLEFQYFNAGNITNRRLEAYLDVQYKDSDGALKWYENLHMGWFTVKSCARNSKTGIIKASCYNKLMSDYLDAEAKSKVATVVAAGEDGVSGKASVQHILESLLDDFAIETDQREKANIPLSSYPFYTDNPRRSAINYPSGFIIGYSANIGLARESLSSDEYYSFTVNYKKLREIMKEYCNYKNTVIDGSTGQTLGEFLDIGDGSYMWGSLAIRSYNGTNPIELAGDIFQNHDVAEYGYFTNLNMPSQYTTFGVLNIEIPVQWATSTDAYREATTADKNSVKTKTLEISNRMNEFLTIEKKKLSDLQKIRITSSTVSSLTNGVTLRELQSAVFEQIAKFGRLDRETDLFSGAYLNNERLLPGSSTEPGEAIYPKSTAENSNPAIYTDLFADEGNVHNFKYLIITYKGTDGQEHTLQRTVNANGTDNYNMSNNWLFKNLQWTSNQVGTYADEMVALIKNVSWFPFEMDCNGLPYVEAGDEIEITINNQTYTTYILQRTLQGIQRLQDTYYNGTVNTF